MNRLHYSTARRTGVVIACAAAAGLLVAACGTSSGGGSSNNGSSSGSSSAKTSASKSASAGSSSSSSSSSTVSSSSVPFPIAAGNTWIYQSTPEVGVSGTVIDKILSVTPVSGGQQVTMQNAINGAAPTQVTYIFHSDGSITYPFSQLGTSAVIVKGTLEWPPASVIASGQATHSTIVIAVSNGTSKTDVTANVTVKGAGTATVTVPAGTYSTTIVQMTESFTVLGYAGSIVVDTYLANGVGPVQSTATITEAGHSEEVSHLELKTFTQG